MEQRSSDSRTSTDETHSSLDIGVQGDSDRHSDFGGSPTKIRSSRTQDYRDGRLYRETKEYQYGRKEKQSADDRRDRSRTRSGESSHSPNQSSSLDIGVQGDSDRHSDFGGSPTKIRSSKTQDYRDGRLYRETKEYQYGRKEKQSADDRRDRSRTRSGESSHSPDQSSSLDIGVQGDSDRHSDFGGSPTKIRSSKTQDYRDGRLYRETKEYQYGRKEKQSADDRRERSRTRSGDSSHSLDQSSRGFRRYAIHVSGQSAKSTQRDTHPRYIERSRTRSGDSSKSSDRSSRGGRKDDAHDVSEQSAESSQRDRRGSHKKGTPATSTTSNRSSEQSSSSSARHLKSQKEATCTQSTSGTEVSGSKPKAASRSKRNRKKAPGKSEVSSDDPTAEETGIYSDWSDSPSIDQSSVRPPFGGDLQSSETVAKPSTSRDTGLGLDSLNGEDLLTDSPCTRRIVVLKDSLNKEDLSSVELPKRTHVIPGRLSVKVPRIKDERRIVQTGRLTVVDHKVVVNETNISLDEDVRDHSELSQEEFGSSDESNSENQEMRMGNKLPKDRVVKVRCQEDKLVSDVDMAEVDDDSEEFEKELSDVVDTDQTGDEPMSEDSAGDSKKSERNDEEILDCVLDESDCTDHDESNKMNLAKADSSGEDSIVEVGIDSSTDNSDVDDEDKEGRRSSRRGPSSHGVAHGRRQDRIGGLIQDESDSDINPVESDFDEEISFPRPIHRKPRMTENDGNDIIIEIPSSEEDSNIDDLQDVDKTARTGSESDLPDLSGAIFNRNSSMNSERNLFNESSAEFGSVKARFKGKRSKEKEPAPVETKSGNKRMKGVPDKTGTVSSGKNGKQMEEISQEFVGQEIPLNETKEREEEDATEQTNEGVKGKGKAHRKKKHKWVLDRPGTSNGRPEEKGSSKITIRKTTKKNKMGRMRNKSLDDTNSIPKARKSKRNVKHIEKSDISDSELPDCSSSDDEGKHASTNVGKIKEVNVEKGGSDSELYDPPSYSEEDLMEVQESEDEEFKERKINTDQSDSDLSDSSSKADHSRQTPHRHGHSDPTDAQTTSKSAKRIMKGGKKRKGQKAVAPLSDSEVSVAGEMVDKRSTSRMEEEVASEDEVSGGSISREEETDDDGTSMIIKDEALADDERMQTDEVDGQREDVQVKPETPSDTDIDGSIQGDIGTDNQSSGDGELRTVGDWLDIPFSQPNTQSLPEPIIEEVWDSQMFDDLLPESPTPSPASPEPPPASPEHLPSASDSTHNEGHSNYPQSPSLKRALASREKISVPIKKLSPVEVQTLRESLAKKSQTYRRPKRKFCRPVSLRPHQEPSSSETNSSDSSSDSSSDNSSDHYIPRTVDRSLRPSRDCNKNRLTKSERSKRKGTATKPGFYKESDNCDSPSTSSANRRQIARRDPGNPTSRTASKKIKKERASDSDHDGDKDGHSTGKNRKKVEEPHHSRRREPIEIEKNFASDNEDGNVGEHWISRKQEQEIKRKKYKKSPNEPDANESPPATVSALPKTSDDGDFTGVDSPLSNASMNYNPKPVVTDSDSDETCIEEEAIDAFNESNHPELDHSSDSDRTMIEEDDEDDHDASLEQSTGDSLSVEINSEPDKSTIITTSDEGDMAVVDSPGSYASKEYNPKPVVSESDSDETFIGDETNASELGEDSDSNLPQPNTDSDSDENVEDHHEPSFEQCTRVSSVEINMEPSEVAQLQEESDGENVCNDSDSQSNGSHDVAASSVNEIKDNSEDNDQLMSSSIEDGANIVNPGVSSDKEKVVTSAKKACEDGVEDLQIDHPVVERGQNSSCRKRLVLQLTPKSKKKENLKRKWKTIETSVPKMKKSPEEQKIKVERNVTVDKEFVEDIIVISDDSDEESLHNEKMGDTKQATSSKNGIKSKSFYGGKDASCSGKQRKTSWNDLSKSDLDMTDSDHSEAEGGELSPTTQGSVDSTSSHSQENSSLSSQLSERDIFSRPPEENEQPVDQESQSDISQKTSSDFFPSTSDLSFLDSEESAASVSKVSSKGKGKVQSKNGTGSKVGGQKEKSCATNRSPSPLMNEPFDGESGQQRSDKDEAGDYFPRASQLSFDLNNTQELMIDQDPNSEGTAISDDPPRLLRDSVKSIPSGKDSSTDRGIKLLPCQKNAWSVEDLNPQERYLMLHEPDPDFLHSSPPDLVDDIPSNRDENVDTMNAAKEANNTDGENQAGDDTHGDAGSLPSTSTGIPVNKCSGSSLVIASKKVVPFKASRAESLLQTMKETKLSQQKKGVGKKPSQNPVHTKQNPAKTKQQGNADKLDVCPDNHTKNNSEQRRGVCAKQSSIKNDQLNAKAVEASAKVLQKSDHSGLLRPSNSGQEPNISGSPLDAEDHIHTRQETGYTGQHNVSNEHPGSVQTAKETTKHGPVSSGLQPSVSSGQQHDPVPTDPIQRHSVPKGYKPVEMIPIHRATQSRDTTPVSSTSRQTSTATVPSASAGSRVISTTHIPTPSRGVASLIAREPTDSIVEEPTEDAVLATLLSWDTDWLKQHGKDLPSSFPMCQKRTENKNSYEDVGRYQKAFLAFLLAEMWDKIACAAQTDICDAWKQSSPIVQDKQTQRVQYEASSASLVSKPRPNDIVLVDMSFISQSQKHYQFGLVLAGDESGPNTVTKTITLALHKSTLVPSSTRLKMVTSLTHELNQVRAVLDLPRSPLARDIACPGTSSIYSREGSTDGAQRLTDDRLMKSYKDAIFKPPNPSAPSLIRLMDGPPGSGKTRWLAYLAKEILQVNKKHGETHDPRNPHKLLVCAPSNKALDILLREIWRLLRPNQDSSQLGNKVGNVEIVRVGQKEEDVDPRLVNFLLTNVATRTKKEADPHDELTDEEVQIKILQRADVVGCTLRDCGSQMMRASFEREETTEAGRGRSKEKAKGKHKEEIVFAVIVDDASHCLETEILLPLQCRSHRLFLAGDQRKGVVKVKSKESRELNYNLPLLERLAENFEQEDSRIHRWEYQHRMKREIAAFPSSFFYWNKLQTDERSFPANWRDFPLHPYILFDVSDGKETPDGKSFMNEAEVNFIKELVPIIMRPFFRETSVGIITPYTRQKELLKSHQAQLRMRPESIGTLEDFYGWQKDIIILSCTKTSPSSNTEGFVLDERELNVALTRARLCLIIVGNMKVLQKMNTCWKNLIDKAQGKGILYSTSRASYSREAAHCLRNQSQNPIPANVAGPVPRMYGVQREHALPTPATSLQSAATAPGPPGNSSSGPRTHLHPLQDQSSRSHAFAVLPCTATTPGEVPVTAQRELQRGDPQGPVNPAWKIGRSNSLPDGSGKRFHHMHNPAHGQGSGRSPTEADAAEFSAGEEPFPRPSVTESRGGPQGIQQNSSTRPVPRPSVTESRGGLQGMRQNSSARPVPSPSVTESRGGLQGIQQNSSTSPGNLQRSVHSPKINPREQASVMDNLDLDRGRLANDRDCIQGRQSDTNTRSGNVVQGVNDPAVPERQESSNLLDTLLKQTEQCHGVSSPVSSPARIRQRHKSAPSPGGSSCKKRVRFSCEEEPMSKSRIEERAAKIRKLNEPFKSAVSNSCATTGPDGAAHLRGGQNTSKRKELHGILKQPNRSSFTGVSAGTGSPANRSETSSSGNPANAANTNRTSNSIGAGNPQPDIIHISKSQVPASSSNNTARPAVSAIMKKYQEYVKRRSLTTKTGSLAKPGTPSSEVPRSRTPRSGIRTFGTPATVNTDRTSNNSIVVPRSQQDIIHRPASNKKKRKKKSDACAANSTSNTAEAETSTRTDPRVDIPSTKELYLGLEAKRIATQQRKANARKNKSEIALSSTYGNGSSYPKEITGTGNPAKQPGTVANTANTNKTSNSIVAGNPQPDIIPISESQVSATSSNTCAVKSTTQKNAGPETDASKTDSRNTSYSTRLLYHETLQKANLNKPCISYPMYKEAKRNSSKESTSLPMTSDVPLNVNKNPAPKVRNNDPALRSNTVAGTARPANDVMINVNISRNIPESGTLAISPVKSASRRASIVDTHEGRELDTIAKGMFSNQNISKQKQGTKVAGRVLGKQKHERKRRASQTENRPDKESSNGPKRRRRRKATKNENSVSSSASAQNERTLQENQGTRQGVPGAGSSSGSSVHQQTRQSDPCLASSSGNQSSSHRGGPGSSSYGHSSNSEIGQRGTSSDRVAGPAQRGQPDIQGDGEGQQPSRDVPPARQIQRQDQLHRLATNPSRLVPSLQHQHEVQRQHGFSSTELTAPQPYIRHRRRSNQVKDPNMDFPD